MIKNLDIKLKTQRAKENLSQPKFCKKYGFKVVTYRTWEQGSCYPNRENEELLLSIIRGDNERN